MKTKPIPDLYRTSDVATILGTEEWRVKNFSKGDAYKLPASLKVGAGRRKLPLYNFDALLRMAIADELVSCGFGPEAVGNAMDAISERQLTSWTDEIAASAAEGREPDWRVLPVLVGLRGKWVVEKGKQFEERALGYGGECRGTFVLNFPSLLEQVVKKITELEGENQLVRRTRTR